MTFAPTQYSWLQVSSLFRMTGQSVQQPTHRRAHCPASINPGYLPLVHNCSYTKLEVCTLLGVQFLACLLL